MSLKSVKSLVFSFKGLRAIDFLVGLESLTKLYLDNNNISKIENISHLPTLTLLDLSFNKIQKIEGLEALTNLEDLSLYNNQIEKTSGLETLQNLNSLSLGKNFLKSLDSVLSLRRLKCLRVLTLEGNPISKDPEYRNYVIAHVEDLKYLDHRFVDTSCVTAAREQYQDEMLEIKHKEAEEEVMIKVATEKAREQEAFKEANLVGVDTMFDVMLDEDPEYHKLKEIPGLLNSLQEYRQKYFTATEELKSIMLSQLAKKMEEVKSWSAAVTILLDERDKKAREMTIQLKKLNKEIFLKMQRNPIVAEEKNEILQQENDRLREELMEPEMLTVSQIHGMWSAFDSNYSAITEYSKQQFQNYFGTIRMLDNNFTETVAAESTVLMEQFAMNELADVELEEARMLLQDKDAMLNSIQASHDARILKIDSMEDQKLRREEEMQRQMNNVIQGKEIKRNRERVEEIDFVLRFMQDEINDSLTKASHSCEGSQTSKVGLR
ncbi:hypothetical protein O6H91_Y305300 [Diphasiastrum complanatum]|nr:hypothetical protein O6H91_Y305300 [Diphasiastrum complanatum]